jgi:hypothetical protein
MIKVVIKFSDKILREFFSTPVSIIFIITDFTMNTSVNRASTLGEPSGLNESLLQKEKGISLTNKLLPLKIPKNIHEAYMCYDFEHLRKCAFRAIKQMDFRKPIESIDRDDLQLIFDEMNVFVTKYQLTEGYFMATYNMHDASQEIFDGKIRSSSSNQKFYNLFDFEKFIRWLQRNLHKMRNFNRFELDKFNQRKRKERGEPPLMEPGLAVSVALSKQKRMRNKKIRDIKYKELLSALDFEKRYRRDYVSPALNELPLHTYSKDLRAENLKGSVLKITSVAYVDKKLLLDDIDKLKGLNRDIDAMMQPLLNDILNGDPNLNLSKEEIQDKILDVYKKKLENEDKQARNQAELASIRLEQAEVKNQLQEKLELQALMREEPSAHEANRLFMLMEGEEVRPRPPSIKLKEKHERRVRTLLETRMNK